MYMRIDMIAQEALCVSGLGFGAFPVYPFRMSVLAKNIEALRAGFDNQQEFADAVGATQGTVSRWIGGALPRPANLVALARIGGCSVDQLINVPKERWGPSVAYDLSEEMLKEMIEIAIREIPATTTIGDWPRLAASSLHTQLERLKASREALLAQAEGKSPAASKGGRSRNPKKSNAQG